VAAPDEVPGQRSSATSASSSQGHQVVPPPSDWLGVRPRASGWGWAWRWGRAPRSSTASP
jgi:hypothetical protein